MTNKKLKISALILLGIGLAELQAQTMYVKPKSGNQTAYVLNGISKITFSSGTIIISKETRDTVSYALNNLQYLNFADLIDHVAKPLHETVEVFTYPNPTKAELYISLNGLENQSVSIEIISIDGRIVYYEVLREHEAVHKINMFEQPNGLYICRIKSGTTIQTTKFIKQ